MIDINLFREDKGGNPELLRESQRRRFADVTLIDKVIEKDNEWRKLRTQTDGYNKYINFISKMIGKKFREKKETGKEDEQPPKEIVDIFDPSNLSNEDGRKFLEKEEENLTINQLKNLSKIVKDFQNLCSKNEQILIKERDAIIMEIGNIVHESCVVSDNEDNNGIVRTIEASDNLKEQQKNFLEKKGKFLNHIDVMNALSAMHLSEGSETAGSRGYFISGPLVLLNLALVHYSIEFLTKKGYNPIYPPFFMKKSMMSKVAQLAEFDETLYKIPADNSQEEEEVNEKEEDSNDLYLIATSEQPICSYHNKKRFQEKELPVKYVGYSTCFRKEAGSHGRDTLGIFRVHQFEKIEQFCVTSPDKSWEMMEEMIKNSEEFYKSLGLEYQVVNIVSGKLNNAAAKKLDLEAYFPASKVYRELVSCSNCTDYQARRLDVRFLGSKKGAEKAKKVTNVNEKSFVHMLNSTLCATSRTMCCICENYQVEDGVIIPEVLRKYMGGLEKINFVIDPYKTLPEKNGKKKSKKNQ